MGVKFPDIIFLLRAACGAGVQPRVRNLAFTSGSFAEVLQFSDLPFKFITPLPSLSIQTK